MARVSSGLIVFGTIGRQISERPMALGRDCCRLQTENVSHGISEGYGGCLRCHVGQAQAQAEEFT